MAGEYPAGLTQDGFDREMERLNEDDVPCGTGCELHFIQFGPLELDAAIEALKEYGPARMGNHTLYEQLMKKLEGAKEVA